MRALQPARFPHQPRCLHLLEQIPSYPEPPTVLGYWLPPVQMPFAQVRKQQPTD